MAGVARRGREKCRILIRKHLCTRQQVGKLSGHARKLLGFSSGEEDMRAFTRLN